MCDLVFFFFLNQQTLHRKHWEHKSSAPPQTAGPDASSFHGKCWLPERWPFVRHIWRGCFCFQPKYFSLTNYPKDPQAQTGLFLFFFVGLGWRLPAVPV